MTRRFGRPGDDLLFRTLRHSTIGAEGFHGRVRDGIGCRLLAIITRSSKPSCDLPGRFDRASGFSDPNARLFCMFIFASVGRGYVCRLGLPLRVRIKPIERLVPVSFMRYRTSTPGLSTRWSTSALKGNLVLRGASRVDAFSGYLVHT